MLAVEVGAAADHKCGAGVVRCEPLQRRQSTELLHTSAQKEAGRLRGERIEEWLTRTSPALLPYAALLRDVLGHDDLGRLASEPQADLNHALDEVAARFARTSGKAMKKPHRRLLFAGLQRAQQRRAEQ